MLCLVRASRPCELPLAHTRAYTRACTRAYASACIVRRNQLKGCRVVAFSESMCENILPLILLRLRRD